MIDQHAIGHFMVTTHGTSVTVYPGEGPALPAPLCVEPHRSGLDELAANVLA
jgi:hypothetical protein